MKLSDQVVSLDLAKRLKELGVKQESLFLWALDVVDGWRLVLREVESPDDKGENDFAAFTVAELGEMLPSWVAMPDVVNLYFRKYEEGWRCGYENRDGDVESKFDGTEADARAKMLIYLIENNLLKV